MERRIGQAVCGVDAQRRLADDGIALVAGRVPPSLVAALVEATDAAVAAESTDFPPGDEQHGRVLFAPAHGGAFLDLLEHAELFAPMEELLGEGAILYTMTTSVLAPGSRGPVHELHVDFDRDRPSGLACTAMVLLDPFREENGATEFVVGEPACGEPGAGDVLRLHGDPGDVCYFDPRLPHRSTANRSSEPRRAVLVQMVKPWMKQRFDVARMLDGVDTTGLSAAARRRLGLLAQPPGSVSEFVARRATRPW